MSRQFEDYYKKEFMDMIEGNEVESKKIEDALSWLESMLKKI
jgi:hypothetical protein